MGEFEKDLQDIFEKAEFQPSDKVWAGVEQQIKSKKRIGILVNWQKYGVAAAVALILGVGYLFSDQIFDVKDSVSTEKELSKNEKPASENSEPSDKPASDDTEPADQPIEQVQTETDSEKEGAADDNQKLAAPVKPKSPITSTTLLADSNTEIQERQTPEANDKVETTISDEPLGLELVELSLMGLKERKSVAYIFQWRSKYLVPAPDFGYKVKPAAKKEQRQMALLGSLAGGSFNPESGATVSTEALQGFDPMDATVANIANSENQQESSFSVGAGISLPLGDRWNLRTGLHFAQYRFSNMASAYSVEDGKRLPIYIPAGFKDDEVFFVGNYNLTNTLSTISIPASFSFRMAHLGKLDISISAGVGMDYIASYRIKGDLNFLETRKVVFSENQLFNRFNLAGLTGLEFNYKLNEKFGMTAEMFFRKYLISGNTTSFDQRSPAFYGLGLSVNYFLRR